MASILFIQTAFLGDVVLSTALVESWKLHNPKDQVDILVRKGNEQVFLNNPNVRNVLTWDKKKHKWKHWLHLLRTIRKTRYDQVFNLQRFATTGLLTVFSSARQTNGFQKNPFSIFFTRSVPHQIDPQQGLHEIQRNHLLIEPYTGPECAAPKLYVTNTYPPHPLLDVEGSFITLSPASVWFTKQFHLQGWVDLLLKVPDNLHVILLGAPSDKPLCEDLADKVKIIKPQKNIINLCGLTNVLESAAIMKSACMNYVNDSAPLHLASAVNAPVCAVFCSTIPGFGFGPLSEQSFVIETREVLNCRPCGLHGKMKCPEGHFRCATTIETEQLMSALKG